MPHAARPRQVYPVVSPAPPALPAPRRKHHSIGPVRASSGCPGPAKQAHVLICAVAAPPVQEGDGRYGSKWCILALKEVGGGPGPKRKEPLGRVVLDLAEFVDATGGQAQHSFEISCTADVAAAAGPLPPRMLITLGSVTCCVVPIGVILAARVSALLRMHREDAARAHWFP